MGSPTSAQMWILTRCSLERHHRRSNSQRRGKSEECYHPAQPGAVDWTAQCKHLGFAFGSSEGEVAFSPSSRETGALTCGGEVSAVGHHVSCKTLDSVLHDLRSSVWTVPKMDVEGCEEMILQGGTDTLSGQRIRVWLFELADAGLRRFNSSSDRLVGPFESHGYSIHYWEEERQHLGLRGDAGDRQRAHYIACCRLDELHRRLRL
jgi:FkbM family methyltransferase